MGYTTNIFNVCYILFITQPGYLVVSKRDPEYG